MLMHHPVRLSGGGGVVQNYRCGWTKIGKRACVVRNVCEIINATNSIPILITTLVPGSATDLGIELHGLPWSMPSQPQLRSGR